MYNEDRNGKDQLDSRGDVCGWTGEIFAELDRFNVGTDERDEWMPFVSESAYLAWMESEARPIPALQS